MRVVYYSHPHFLESAMLFARAMCQRTDFHLLLEVSPSSWENAMFDMERVPLLAGIQPADPIIGRHFSPQIRAYWRDLASFNLVSHTSRRSIHPASWWTSHTVMRFIRNLKADILHLDDPDMSLRLALDIVELGRIPLILNVHDPSPHTGEHNWRKTLARRLIFPRVHRFILHNQSQAEVFCRANNVAPDRVAVIHLGVYDVYREWIAKSVMQSDHTVLFFGRLSPYKGLDVLYDAAQRVAERVPGVRFVVAGRPTTNYLPPQRPLLVQGGRIELIQHYITNEYLAELFQQATVVVCPYLEATQSGVVLTAYAFNRPIVASAVGGLPEYVVQGDTGLLVTPGDPKELAEALVNVLLNKDLQIQFQNRIRSHKAEHFSWHQVANQISDVYERTISSQ